MTAGSFRRTGFGAAGRIRGLIGAAVLLAVELGVGGGGVAPGDGAPAEEQVLTRFGPDADPYSDREHDRKIDDDNREINGADFADHSLSPWAVQKRR